MDLTGLLAQEVCRFDGGFGTLAAAMNLRADCPELLNLESPQGVLAIHKAYVEAGAQVIETNSLGANPIKLSEKGLAGRCGELATAAVKLARQAAGEKALVAFSLGTCGQFLYPVGGLSMADAIACYQEPIRAAQAAGADFVIAETFTDIGDMRAALLAAASLNMPAVASFTFEKSGRTMTGSTPQAAALAAAALGACALGINCSTGPEDMLGPLKAMRAVCPLPVIVQPNAGLPELTPEGLTRFTLGPGDMAGPVAALLDAGAAGIGGCCGTTPEHIRLFADLAKATPPPAAQAPIGPLLSSQRQIIPLPLALSSLAALRLTDADVSDLYDLEEEHQAVLLDVTDLTPEDAAEATAMAQLATARPLLFAAENGDALRSVLRAYHGVTALRVPQALVGLLPAFGALALPE